MRLKEYFFLFILFCSIISSANSQLILWDKTYGGNQTDFGLRVRQNILGEYFFTGTSISPISGEKTQQNQGGLDYWTIKLNSSGLLLWDKTAGGLGVDNITDINISSQNRIIQGGISGSPVSGDKTLPSRGGGDCWINILDDNGNSIQELAFGGTAEDGVEAIITSHIGNDIIIACSDSPISGEKTQNSRGGLDYWLIKIDTLGNKIWDRTIGGTNRDEAISLVETADRGYLLAGNSRSQVSTEKSQPSRGGFDYWVVKTDSNGMYQWDRTYGGSGQESVVNILSTQDGNYLISGTSDSPVSGEKTQASRGGTDLWIIKIDPQGNLIWEKTYGGALVEEIGYAAETPDGGFILGAGSNSGVSGEKTEGSRGAFDFWMLRLDVNGTLIWDKTIGGLGTDAITSLLVLNSTEYLLAGFSDSNISGEKTENSRGDFDYWLVKVADTTVIPPADTISGTLWADSPTNCTYDPGEIPVPYRLVQATNGTDFYYALADAQGRYSFVLPPGNYTLSLVLNGSTQYSPACPGGFNYTVNLTGGSHLQNQDFFLDRICDIAFGISGLQLPGEPSVCAPNPQTSPCIGQKWQYCFSLTNTGSSPLLPGTFFGFSVDPGRRWVASTAFPNAPALSDPCGINPMYLPNSGQGIFFLSQAFPPGQSCRFCAAVDVLGPAPATAWTTSFSLLSGSSACATGSVGGSAKIFSERVRCACDPNSIDVSPVGCGTGGNIPLDTDTLTYTIHFQNLGTGPAEDVIILDTLDSTLNPETFRLVDPGPLTALDILPGNILRATFQDIFLPPAFLDSAGSQSGFQFEIQLAPGLPDGTIIENQVAIYFDQNVPVLTNTVRNTLRNQPQPSVDLGNSGQVYWGYPPQECTQLSPTVSGQGPFTYLWNEGSITSTLSVCPKASTLYGVEIKDREGCVGVDTVRVEVIDVHCGPRNQEVEVCFFGRAYCVRATQVAGLLTAGGQLGPCGSQKQLTQTSSPTLIISPNPINEGTILEWIVLQNGLVTLELLNAQGQRIEIIYSGNAIAGREYKIAYSGQTVTSGLYFLRMHSAQGSVIKKLIKMAP